MTVRNLCGLVFFIMEKFSPVRTCIDINKLVEYYFRANFKY